MAGIVQYIPDKRWFIRDNKPETIVHFLYSDRRSDGSLFSVDVIAQYTVFVLFKDPVSQNEFSEIIINNTDPRIGALVSLQSIESINANLIDCWQKWYVFIASYYYCLNRESLDANTNKDRIVLAILENSRCPKEISQKELLVSLQCYGVYPDRYKKNSLTDVLPRKVKVNLISPYLATDNYIHNLLTNYIYEENPIVLFMCYYQVIEILMDDMLVKGFIDNILNTFHGNLSLRAEKGETTELTRINKILNESGIVDRPEFLAQCKVVLRRIQKNCEDSFADSLYQVRNSLVHRGRLFIDNKSLLNDLSIVNDYFELLIYDIISEYRKKASLSIDSLYGTLQSCSVINH